jgi:uncharacterized protein (TIGR00645 family)
VKLAMALIGISSIHLLKTFINAGSSTMSERTIFWQVAIHITFVGSALALAWIDVMSHRASPREESREEGR